MISLGKFELSLLQEYYRNFEADPDLYMDPSNCHPYRYDPHRVAAYYRRLSAQIDRVDRLILLDGAPVGEIAFKRIDLARRSAELSIHLQNDRVKNRGIGTEAERLMLAVGFRELALQRITADAVLKNTRSQHVLERVEFREIGRDDQKILYEITREEWAAQNA